MKNSQTQNINDDNLQQVAGFVAKIIEILRQQEFGRIIYWSPNGCEFTIKDPIKFQQIVLPRYFRHNKINSFVRQLNMYGFHKTKHNSFKSTFKHPYFKKSKQQLLPLVKRKLKNNQQNQKQVIEQKQTRKQVLTSKKITIEKQPEVTSVSIGKYFSFSNQFIETTKMINYSFKKLSYTDLSNLESPDQNKNQDYVSIEREIEESNRNQDFNCFNFQNVSCFFSSGINF